MKKYAILVFILASQIAHAQTLTVEKIMQDAKWIGTSPTNIVWRYDNSAIYFNWNPTKSVSDSAYSYSMQNVTINKETYNNSQMVKAIANGVYNQAHTKIAFDFKADLYLMDIATSHLTRITQTAEAEYNPYFILNDSCIVYQSGNTLFSWNIATGFTKQLADIQKEQPASKNPGEQDTWLQQQQLSTSDILLQRKKQKEARTNFLKAVKHADSIPVIYTGNSNLESLQVSPDGRFFTYNLVDAPSNATIANVPDYITASGYTTNISTRGKAGVPQGKYACYVFDTWHNTAILIKTDALPGITVQPDYTKDYPAKFSDTVRKPRDVYVYAVSWNQTGTAAVLDIFSQDFKDRWLMQLNAATGDLQLLDHQRDEAWIAGPGIAWVGSTNTGWVNAHSFYFQSEASGYSHLYVVDINTHTKKQITQGNYEIQEARLSSDKQYFYIISNEEHPGKQSVYRINSDGSNKQKITSLTGGYEISISPDEKYIAYRYSYQNKPWELYVQENAPGAKPLQVTNKAMSDEWKAYPWRDTKIISFTNRDGLPVYARIYEPVKATKNKAAVIFVHGAGYLQNVTYGWSYYYHEFMFNNLLADKGYTVIDIDYQASAGYGRNWRTAIYRYMGGKDLNDEVDAANYLVKAYGIDPNRIGMYGGSYGGFMTLMALFTQPNVFKAGAALRPVTDWGHYDAGYTSAILNQPYNDSIAYQRSSPINFAAGLKNHLLICHGMVDVNVHYQDAVRLAQRLIELGKNNWELASYPVEDHSFIEPSSWTDEYKRILQLFNQNLLKK
jgi:dipeptidyl aminopeptidase/acylaminoacyl peptidase